MDITITLDPGQVGYLRYVLAAAAERAENRRDDLRDRGEEIFGEFPVEEIQTAQAEYELARSLLTKLA